MCVFAYLASKNMDLHLKDKCVFNNTFFVMNWKKNSSDCFISCTWHIVVDFQYEHLRYQFIKSPTSHVCKYLHVYINPCRFLFNLFFIIISENLLGTWFCMNSYLSWIISDIMINMTGSINQVQVLDGTTCISLCTNALLKGMNPSLLFLFMGK